MKVKIILVLHMMLHAASSLAKTDEPTHALGTPTEPEAKKPPLLPPPNCYVQADLKNESRTSGTVARLVMETAGEVETAILDMIKQPNKGGFKDVKPFASTGDLPARMKEMPPLMYLASVWGPGGGSTCSVNIAWFGPKLPDPPSCALSAPQKPQPPGDKVSLKLKVKSEVDKIFFDGEEIDFKNNHIDITPEATASYTVAVWGPGGVSTCSTLVEVSGK